MGDDTTSSPNMQHTENKVMSQNNLLDDIPTAVAFVELAHGNSDSVCRNNTKQGLFLIWLMFYSYNT